MAMSEEQRAALDEKLQAQAGMSMSMSSAKLNE
jgi:hypothetical protein